MPIEAKRGRWADNTREEAAVAHEARRTILRLVRRLPGIRLHELAAATRQTQSGVLWHVQVLERAGFLSSERLGPVRYYVPPTLASEERRLAAVMATVRIYGRRAALLQLARGELTRRNLQGFLGISASAAGSLLAYLTREGLVTEDGRVELTALGVKAAARLLRFDILGAA